FNRFVCHLEYRTKKGKRHGHSFAWKISVHSVNDVSHLEHIDGWETYFSVHHPRSKGVAILIKNELPFEHVKHDIEPTGSYIVLVCKLYGKCFTLVNVYNHAKEHKVLQFLSEYLRQTAKGVLIVAGDFNTVLNTDLDRQYPTGHVEPLRPYLEEFISSLMLKIIFCTFYLMFIPSISIIKI
uniref:Endonuclease/exonuclease/phosphatase domain-containing protein n=1 Tax=Cyprinus carpio TaxID=7962 RepID=A0A8C2GZ25_CYPCA